MDIQKRIEYIDIAKAIGIILVIIGHTIGGMLRGVIFSFHMPLFFIVSGMTYRYSTSTIIFREKTWRAFKQFILAALVLFSVREVLYVLNGKEFAPSEFGLTILYASGVPVEMSEAAVPAIGLVWFLFAFFICRELCDLLNLYVQKYFQLIICAMTLAGVIIGSIIWLPFSLDIALAATIFFFVGNKFVEKNLGSKIISADVKLIVLSSLIIVVGLLLEYLLTGNYLELASREYPLFPICYIVAVAFVIMLLIFSNKLLKLKFISKHLKFIGTNTMNLFAIHYLDVAWGGYGRLLIQEHRWMIT